MRSIRWAWNHAQYLAAVDVAVREAGLAGIAKDIRRQRVAVGLLERLRKAGSSAAPLRITHAQSRLLHESLGETGYEGELRELFDEAHRLAEEGIPVRERVRRIQAVLEAIEERSAPEVTP